MEYTLTKAAEVTGKGKSTIHRAIKNGKLSATRHDDGSYSIDASELHRVFPRNIKEPSPRDDKERSGAPPLVELEVLRMKAAMLEEQLGRERDSVEDLRRRLDRAEERVLALSAPSTPGESKMGLLARLWGR
jgi:excisionase family DNA binding protein